MIARRKAPVAAVRHWLRTSDWDPGLLVVLAAAAAFAAYMIWLCVLRYDAFSTARFDLGDMVQAVWNTAHGNFLETTDSAGQQVSRLGSHVDPILVLLVPVWWVWPSPVMLLVVQAVAVATGAVPAYWIAMRWIGDWRIAAACAGAYLLYPPMQWAVLFDFHPVTLATPLFLWSIWAIEARRDVWLWVFIVLVLLTKEEVGLAVALLGIWVYVRHRRTRTALAMVAIGLVWTGISVEVIIPHFAPSGVSPFISRYSALGSSPRQIIESVIRHPRATASLLTRRPRLTYLYDLLVPLVFLPLLSPLLVLCAVPELLLNMLSGDHTQYEIYYQYTSVITPFLIVGMIGGVVRVRALGGRVGRIARAPVVAIVVLLGAGVLAGYHLGPFPLWQDVPGGSTYENGQFVVTAHDGAMARAVAVIPSGAVVSASDQLGGRLSARRRILSWPIVGDAQWVIVDTVRAWLIDKRVTPAQQAPYLHRLEANPAFHLVFSEDGVLVFRRVAGG